MFFRARKNHIKGSEHWHTRKPSTGDQATPQRDGLEGPSQMCNDCYGARGDPGCSVLGSKHVEFSIALNERNQTQEDK